MVWKMEEKSRGRDWQEEPLQLKCLWGWPWAVLRRVSTRFYHPKFCGLLLIRFYPPPQQRTTAADWFWGQGPQAAAHLEAATANRGLRRDSARKFTALRDFKGISAL